MGPVSGRLCPAQRRRGPCARLQESRSAEATLPPTPGAPGGGRCLWAGGAGRSVALRGEILETSGKHAPGGSSTFVPVRAALVPRGPAIQSLLSCSRGCPHPARSLPWAHPVLLAASPRRCRSQRPLLRPPPGISAALFWELWSWPVSSLLPLPCSPPGLLFILFLPLPSDPCGPLAHTRWPQTPWGCPLWVGVLSCRRNLCPACPRFWLRRS